jgi:hypothetical protein
MLCDVYFIILMSSSEIGLSNNSFNIMSYGFIEPINELYIVWSTSVLKSITLTVKQNRGLICCVYCTYIISNFLFLIYQFRHVQEYFSSFWLESSRYTVEFPIGYLQPIRNITNDN